MTDFPVSAMALLVLGHGGWPLSDAEASALVLRFFVGKSADPAARRKLAAKLGVERFTVEAAQKAAHVHAQAALSELLLTGLAEAKEIGPGRVRRDEPEVIPGRRITYSRTKLGREAMVNTQSFVGAELRKAGWP